MYINSCTFRIDSCTWDGRKKNVEIGCFVYVQIFVAKFVSSQILYITQTSNYAKWLYYPYNLHLWSSNQINLQGVTMSNSIISQFFSMLFDYVKLNHLHAPRFPNSCYIDQFQHHRTWIKCQITTMSMWVKNGFLFLDI